MNRLKAIRCSILGLALVLCALTTVRGGVQVLTLIPTEVLNSDDSTIISGTRSNKPERLVALNFKSDSVPPEDRITRVTLVMYLEAEFEGYQDIDVFIVSKGGPLPRTDVNNLFLALKTKKWPDDNLIEKYNLQKLLAAFLQTSPAGLAAQWDASTQDGTIIGGKREFTLILGSGSFQSSRWYGLRPLDSKLHPRLILEYTTAGEEPTTSQPAAVRSMKSFLPDRNHPSSQKSYRTLVLAAGNPWSYAPAFYGGFVYLMTDVITDGKSQKFLSWHHPLGGIAAPPVELPVTDPGQHLLVSESGHLYIVGDKKIVVYRIGADGIPALRRTVEVPALNPGPQNAPALATNGSIFYVSGTVQEGWTAVGRNPDLQVLWKVSLGNTKASRITVGPSGKFVYLTTQKEGLVTIDARTGDTLETALPNLQQALRSVDNPTLHAPVVIAHADGTEKVYVAANSVDSGELAVFDNAKTRAGASDAASVEVAERWQQLKGLVGQPLISDSDPKKVYVVLVKEGLAELVALDWLSGEPPKQQSEKFTVGKDDPYLLNGGHLVTDKDGNIFVWNGDTESHLRGFTPALEPLFEANIGGLASRTNLWFGSDGSLYAGAVGAKANLQAVVPHYTLGMETQATDISSPTHLWIDGRADIEKGLVLKAGGSVVLGTGFTVKRGTALRVQVGDRN